MSKESAVPILMKERLTNDGTHLRNEITLGRSDERSQGLFLFYAPKGAIFYALQRSISYPTGHRADYIKDKKL